MASKQSPYLEPRRLSDVLAAIQAMGSNDDLGQTCQRCARSIEGLQAREGRIEEPINDESVDQTDDQTDDQSVDQTDDQSVDQTDDQTVDQTVTKEQTNRWKIVFDEHPEFFRRSRMSGEKERYSLIWRRARPLAHMETGKRVLLRAYKQLPPSEKKDHWRPPLTDSAVKTLMDIAISMHSRAVEARHHWHVWVGPVFSVVSALVTAGSAIFIAIVLGVHKSWMPFG